METRAMVGASEILGALGADQNPASALRIPTELGVGSHQDIAALDIGFINVAE
jgi:hypothetical protein